MTKTFSRKNRAMNLEDIAAKAGVSRSTVSRVINNEMYVSSKTREKVLEVINEEGFSPNPAARMLVTKRTNIIGVVIPNTPSVVFADAEYFPTLLQGIAEVTQQRDYAMLLWLGQAGEEERRFYQRVLNNRLMDGLILASASINSPFIDHLMQSSIPFVQVERPQRYVDKINYVTMDNSYAAELAVDHLIDQGYRRIATVTGDLNITDGVDRLEGYRNALIKANIPYDKSLVVEGHFKKRSGYLGIKTLFERGVKFDAVFAGSDMTAFGAIEALQEANYMIPDDIAVVGFDDLPSASQLRPQLTTIRQPIQEKGARATSMLVDLIENHSHGPQQVLLPTQLVIRETSGALLSKRTG